MRERILTHCPIRLTPHVCIQLASIVGKIDKPVFVRLKVATKVTSPSSSSSLLKTIVADRWRFFCLIGMFCLTSVPSGEGIMPSIWRSPGNIVSFLQCPLQIDEIRKVFQHILCERYLNTNVPSSFFFQG